MGSHDLSIIMKNLFLEGSLSLFLHSLDKGLIIIDQMKSIVFINQKAKKYFKAEIKGIQGEKIDLFYSIDQIRDVLKKGYSFSSIKIPSDQGNFYLNMSPIVINRENLGVAMVFEENDSLKNTMDILKLSNTISRELEALFNSSYDEIVVAQRDGKILKVNKAYANLYNMDADEFIGRNVLDLEKEGIIKPSVTLKVIKEGKRITLTQKTNSGRILMVTGNPIFNEKNQLIYVISMSKDITEVHQLKEELEAAREKAQNYFSELEVLKRNEDLEKPIIYKSFQMKNIMGVVQKVARVDSGVLITGESGVGKSMLAEAIHKLSDRCEYNFVSINCGAIPETLIESELFGYEKGAFTGARIEGKIGQIQMADKGTLFLDEISELPLPMQVKLLKVINEKSFMKVGGTKTLTSDFRLVAATNKDLKQMVRDGNFREDLFYRLNVIPIEIPPLRERKEDVMILVDHFWEKSKKKFGRDKKLSKEIYSLLINYDWPGNVRELENCIERIMVTVEEDIVDVEDLPNFLFEYSPQIIEREGIIPLKRAIEETEKKLILKAYRKYKNTYRVAESLGVSQPTVVRRLKKYGHGGMK